MNPVTNYDLLREVTNEILTGREVDADKFFKATELVHEIARNCAEQCERLALANDLLLLKNNKLTWLAMTQTNIITGRLKEHAA